MSWLTLTLSSIIFFVAFNIFAKIFVTNSKNQKAFAFVFNSFCAVWALIFFVFLDAKQLNIPQITIFSIFVLILASVFYAGYESTRFYAIKNLDASAYTPIISFAPVIAFVASIFLYKESIGPVNILGSLLILFSSFWVSFEEFKLKNSTKMGVIFAIAAAIFLGLAWSLDKLGAQLFGAGFFALIIWFVPLIFIYFPYIKTSDLKYEIKIGSYKTPLLALIMVTAYYLQLKALSIGEATKIIPILQSVVVITVLAGIFILKEKQFMYKKIAASTLTFIGILLLI